MPRKSTCQTTLIGSDFHLGEHSPTAVNTFLALVSHVQPQTIILNGDVLDCTELHKSVRGLRQAPRTGRSSLQVGEEMIIARLFLRALRSIAPKGCKIIYLEGNHEARYPGTLAASCPEVYSVIPSLPELLGLRDLGVEWVAENQIYQGVPGWRIVHGSRCSQNAARLDGRQGAGSFCQGHTHRLSLMGETDPATGSTRWYCECGHLRDSKASYTRHQRPDWQAGCLAIVNSLPTLIPFTPAGTCQWGSTTITPSDTPVPGLWTEAAKQIAAARKRDSDRAVHGQLWSAR